MGGGNQETQSYPNTNHFDTDCSNGEGGNLDIFAKPKSDYKIDSDFAQKKRKIN